MSSTGELLSRPGAPPCSCRSTASSAPRGCTATCCIAGIIIVLALASVPLWGGQSISRTLVTFFALLALGQMWNLLGGFAGLISVGQQGYLGIGAYSMWLLGDVLNIHPFICVFLAGVAGGHHRLPGGAAAVPACAAATSPSAPGSSPRCCASSWPTSRPPAAAPARRSSPRRPWIRTCASTARTGSALAVAVGSILIVFFLLRSRLGIALTAIRDDDLAAQSSGVNVFRAKLWVYLVAAFGCGIVGAVVALNLLRIQPNAAFTVNWSAYAIFIVVIGGFGSIEGPIIGAVIYFAMLQTLSDYGELYMLLLGVLAVIMATKAPRGLWGFVEKRWDLHIFPVRRRLEIESEPKDKAPPGEEEPAPAESPAEPT